MSSPPLRAIQLLSSWPACESDLYSIEAVPAAAVEACQQEATTPYCWPPNGSVVCIPDNKVEFYWPSRYYNGSETSYLSIEVNGHTINEADRAATGRLSTYLDLNFESAEIPGRLNNDRIANITITERRKANESGSVSSDYTWRHQGPILILISHPPASPSQTKLTGSSKSTQTPRATPSPPANGHKVFTPGEIAGIGVGTFFALVLLAALAYRCCAGCCLACCFPRETERKRVRAAERRRVAQERAYAQPNVDAIKAAVARGEVWQGPVRPGGVWVSRSRWPMTPAARPEERRVGSTDEITAVDAREERWMEEQRAELERIEVRRREEQSVAETGGEITRTEDAELPVYEAPPPKYTP